MKLRVTEPDFFERLFLPQKFGKWAKIGQKQGLLRLKEKFGHYFH